MCTQKKGKSSVPANCALAFAQTDICVYALACIYACVYICVWTACACACVYIGRMDAPPRPRLRVPFVLACPASLGLEVPQPPARTFLHLFCMVLDAQQLGYTNPRA